MSEKQTSRFSWSTSVCCWAIVALVVAWAFHDLLQSVDHYAFHAQLDSIEASVARIEASLKPSSAEEEPLI